MSGGFVVLYRCNLLCGQNYLSSVTGREPLLPARQMPCRCVAGTFAAVKGWIMDDQSWASISVSLMAYKGNRDPDVMADMEKLRTMPPCDLDVVPFGTFQFTTGINLDPREGPVRPQAVEIEVDVSRLEEPGYADSKLDEMKRRLGVPD
jgi:hypothetical protein